MPAVQFQASIERRRRVVASGPLPPPLAARFTWGEIAVMRIAGDKCRVHGCCTLHIDAIAARSGVHRTTVQNALREAQGREPGRTAIVTVQERRRRGQRSLTDIIRIVSREWLNWLHKAHPGPPWGVGSKRTATKKSNTTDTGLSLGGKPPWGIPDGVIPVERYYRATALDPNHRTANLQTPKEAQRWPSARPAKQRRAKP
jgi:hypothetical protein